MSITSAIHETGLGRLRSTSGAEVDSAATVPNRLGDAADFGQELLSAVKYRSRPAVRTPASEAVMSTPALPAAAAEAVKASTTDQANGAGSTAWPGAGRAAGMAAHPSQVAERAQGAATRPAGSLVTTRDDLARMLQQYIATWLGMVAEYGLHGASGSISRSSAGPTSAASASVGSVAGAGMTRPVSGGVDHIDPSTVEWLHADVSQWRVTSRISDVSITPQSVTIEHTKSGQWPRVYSDGGEIEGNPWVFVNRNGKWYAATYEWLRPGQTEKGVTAENIGAHTKREPIEAWRPQPGEVVGFMVSTPARGTTRTTNERTNIVLTKWPG